MLLAQIFLIVYYLALPFLFLLGSIFVNCVIHEHDCCVCNRLDKETRHHLFLSAASTTWILLLCNLIFMIILTAMEITHWKGVDFSPLFNQTENHNYYQLISHDILRVLMLHRLAVYIFTNPYACLSFWSQIVHRSSPWW